MFAGLFDNYTQQIIIFTGINIIAAYSFFAPFKTGQVSLGQAGFMAVGAYASAVLTQKFGFPFIVSLPVAGPFFRVVGGGGGRSPLCARRGFLLPFLLP